jgi:histidyl-tRNA synthetase
MCAMSIGPPTGMRDWLPQDALLRQHLIETISKVYRLYGYLPIDTPAMEDLSVLLDKGGGENEKLLFKILKRGEKLDEARSGGDLADYGLRFDLTVPLARFVATHQGKLPKVFRRYHIAPVWRADHPQHGRYREFYQCDIDVVGGASPDYEVEIITATERVLKELNLGKYWFRLNDKRLLRDLLLGFGVPEEKMYAVCVLLDKFDKISPMEFDPELGAILGVNSDAWHKVRALAIRSAWGGVDHNVLLSKTTEYYEDQFKKVTDPSIQARIETVRVALDHIMNSVRQINKESRIIFHPIVVRGLDYYTGPVYEAVMDGGPKISILGGGRYDSLIGRFAGKDIPAVGCSIGFERILSLLQERKAGQAAATVSRVLLVNDGQPADFLQRQAEQLRSAGLCVETCLDQDDLGKQFKYAETACILWAIRRFDPSSSSVTVRYLPERKDSTMPLPDFLARLAAAKLA